MTNEILEKLTAIDKNLTLWCKGIEIKDFSAFRVTHFVEKMRFDRAYAMEELNVSIRLGREDLISIILKEFKPCCGKALGGHLRSTSMYHENYDLKDLGEDKLKAMFAIFMEFLDQLLKYCKYTSFSFIVSEPEQKVWYKLITELNTYRVVNEFRNERMNPKNRCVEFCKNLW